ncbi:uncharacterized protein [Palaemon carinicauda]|uniref:uncharacterized protein n=1 Tax=Palaemon carinicauda TaxID=392227 RepID=UPI0035B69D30
MVVTGAMQSTFPPSQAELDHGPSKDAPSLVAANGSPIRCYGTRTLRISIIGRSYSWPFAIADISHPLLDADFFAYYEPLVDVAGKRLVDTGTCQSRALGACPATIFISAVTTQPYADLLQEFPDVSKPEVRHSPRSPSKHGIYHHITTMGPSTHAKFRRLPLQKLKDVKRAFEDMERTKEEHRRHVRVVLKSLQENGLVVRFDKCKFGVEGVDFLGHRVSSCGVKPMATKVDAIRKFPVPTTPQRRPEGKGEET